MLKISYAGRPGLSSDISLQFTFEMCAQPEIAKNLLKTLLGAQGRLRSSLLIDLKSLSTMLVMISSMCVPICNRFHATRANSGEITSFRGGTPF